MCGYGADQVMSQRGHWRGRALCALSVVTQVLAAVVPPLFVRWEALAWALAAAAAAAVAARLGLPPLPLHKQLLLTCQR
jgi:uncharacterized membrane protein